MSQDCAGRESWILLQRALTIIKNSRVCADDFCRSTQLKAKTPTLLTAAQHQIRHEWQLPAMGRRFQFSESKARARQQTAPALPSAPQATSPQKRVSTSITAMVINQNRHRLTKSAGALQEGKPSKYNVLHVSLSGNMSDRALLAMPTT
jgi:hypothetical protein